MPRPPDTVLHTATLEPLPRLASSFAVLPHLDETLLAAHRPRVPDMSTYPSYSGSGGGGGNSGYAPPHQQYQTSYYQ